MLSRLTISSRLRLGFAVLLALLFLVGALGIHEVNHIDSINRQLYMHPFVVSNATQRLRTNAARMRAALDEALLSGNKADLAAARAEMGHIHKQLEAILGLVAERYLGPSQDVARVLDIFARWQRLHALVLNELAQTGRFKSGGALSVENQQLAQEARVATNVLRRFAFGKAQELLALSEKALERSRLILVSSLALALVLGGLIIVWLLRGIMLPLREVADLSEAMASGRAAPPVNYQARDELGRLAANLRALLSGLVGESRSLKEHIPAVLWTADLELTLNFINPRAAALIQARTGQSAQEAVGHLPVDQALADQEGLTPLLAREVLNQGTEREVEVNFSLNGDELHLQQVISPLRDLDGRLIGVMGVGLDISHRRQMEQALAESEAQFRRAIMAAPQPIMLHAEGGEIIQLNQAWTRLSGYDRDKIKTTRDWLKLAHPDSWRKILGGMDRLYTTLESSRHEGEFVIRAADGQELIWDFSSSPLGQLADGRRLVLSLANDITQRKRDERQIQEAEERFRSLVENVPGAVYRCSHDENWTMIFVSEAIKEITGYPAEDFIENKARGYESIIHPDDQDMVRREVDQALAQDSAFTLEYRILRADGDQRWIFEKGSEVHGAGGELICLDGVLLDITEQKTAEQARQRSEALYSTLFNRAGDAILLMSADGEDAGTIIAANEAAGHLHGYEPGELVGMHIGQLDTEEPAASVPDRVRRIMAGEWILEEVEHYRKDGSILPMEISAGLVSLNGERFILAIDRDISERKAAEQERREREARFRELFSNMSSGVAIYRPSPDGQEFYFQEINPAGLRMARLERDQVVGREVREIYPGVESLGLLAVFQRVWASGEPEHHPISQYQDNHVTMWVENYVCKLPTGEVVAIYDDLTKIKQEELERAKLESQLMQNQKLEALGTLAGGIAHDFNNILSAIMGYAELAQQDLPPGSEATEEVEQVLVASERARNLVRQILSFARRDQEPRSPMELTPVIKESFKLLRATVPATVEMNLRQPLAAEQVDADPVQMHQLIMNLCTNAVQAMEDEGGVLELSLDPVKLDQESAESYADLDSGSYLRLSVSDTGPGMTPQVRQRIFEPFYTTKDPGRGTGMGLAVVHGIVQNHGGGITVYSEPGQGTTFHVYLPVHRGAEAPPIEQPLPADLSGDERVLLVDDEPALAELGQRLLGRLGYRVSAYSSPLKAWEAFAADPQAFDVVISDYTMPKMTGQVLAAKILELRPDMPIIICSGFNSQLSEVWLERLGVGAVLNKPLVAHELAAALRSLLDHPRRSGA